jgi:hypothetical protein
MTKVQSIEVPVALIKEYHAEACAEWKERLEEQFPEVFPILYVPGTILVNKRTKKRVVIVLDQQVCSKYMAAVDLETYECIGQGFEEIYSNRPTENEWCNMLGSKLSNWKIEEKKDD